MKVSVMKEICKGCMYCVSTCPKKVLAASEDFNTQGNRYAAAVHPEACICCSMCAEICPDAAIELCGEGE